MHKGGTSGSCPWVLELIGTKAEGVRARARLTRREAWSGSGLLMQLVNLIPFGCSMLCLEMRQHFLCEDRKPAHSGFVDPLMPNVLGLLDSARLLPPPEVLEMQESWGSRDRRVGGGQTQSSYRQFHHFLAFCDLYSPL